MYVPRIWADRNAAIRACPCVTAAENVHWSFSSHDSWMPSPPSRAASADCAAASAIVAITLQASPCLIATAMPLQPVRLPGPDAAETPVYVTMFVPLMNFLVGRPPPAAGYQLHSLTGTVAAPAATAAVVLAPPPTMIARVRTCFRSSS